ncbi:thioredoxin domain-containing protein 6-like [Sarcophilus harrisii]
MSLREFLERQDLLDVCDLIDDPEQARRHIILFFPDFAKAKNLELYVERTLAIIRPDLLDGTMEDVIDLLQKEDFVIKMQKKISLMEEEAIIFYDRFKYRDYFPALIDHVTSAPVVVLSLERANAVRHWRYILYPTAEDEIPTSLREILGPENTLFNQLHGKDTPDAATEETRFFFPFEYTVALIKPHAFQDLRGNIIRQIQEAGYSLSHMKEIQLTADKVATLYSAHKEKDFYEDLVYSMTEGPCMAMIIGKENALEDWRRFAGPTDPEEAKKVAPKSIRALFGKDILNNAVHVSSNKEHAIKTIELLFGDIDLDFEEQEV